MAWVDTKAKWSDLNCSAEQGRGYDAIRLTAQKGFSVLYNTVDPLNVVAAYTATGVPGIGASFDASYTMLKLIRKRVVPVARSLLLFDVLCEYAGQNSPLTEDAIKAWRNEVHEEDRYDDADGAAILNSAGDPIRVRRPFHDKAYQFTRNEATSALVRSSTYDSVVNTDLVTLDSASCAAGTLLLREIAGERIIEGTSYYWKITYMLVRRPDGWLLPVLQRGPRFRPTAGAAPVAVMDRLGIQEANLAANGTLLADGATPVWLDVKRYKTVAFAALGLY